LACSPLRRRARRGRREFNLGVGFNYSNGEYGTSTTTEIVSIPIIARYERGPWIFKLTVPYLSISGGTSVVPGVGASPAAIRGAEAAVPVKRPPQGSGHRRFGDVHRLL